MNCGYCGKDVPQQVGKREKRYCNNVCKQLAYRKRQQGGASLAPTKASAELEGLRAQVIELELEITRLKRLLDLERRMLEDKSKHTFKAWLKKQSETDLSRKLLGDPLVPARETLRVYMHHLRRLHCNEEELRDFDRLWKLMLLQS